MNLFTTLLAQPSSATVVYSFLLMYYSNELIMNNGVKTTLPFMEENQSYYLQETADLHVYQHMYIWLQKV